MTGELWTGALVWCVAGVLACGAEMLVPGVFLLPVGLAALAAAAAAQMGAAGYVPWGVFMVATSVFVLVAARRMRPKADQTNGPATGLVGASCVADRFAGPEGRVLLGDGAWLARMSDRSEPATGTTLRVLGVEGTTLVVAKPL